MYILNISTDMRAQMARTLARFLKEQANLEVKHTLANKAVAALLGFNEHSLAAAIKSGTGVQLNIEETYSVQPAHKCSAPGCQNHADAEVRLYDVYLHADAPEVFDQRDSSCPYLCSSHIAENESKSKGERKPRGIVTYPFTNKQGAQGFTIYRPLLKSTRARENLPEFDTPTYVIDFSDRGSCAKIENAKLNEEISILVRDADDKLRPSIAAQGMLTDEGMFHVTVITDAGIQTFDWTYEFLKDALKGDGSAF
jgi:hypothetical protein